MKTKIFSISALLVTLAATALRIFCLLTQYEPDVGYLQSSPLATATTAFVVIGALFCFASGFALSDVRLMGDAFSTLPRQFAWAILYTLGAEMEVLSNTDGTPSRIDSIDPNAKVGFLEPAQGADGAFAAQLSIMEKNIMRGSFAVETPEIKSGADMSSRTVKMLFADSYLKALSDSMEYQPFLNRIAYLFKFGWFLEKGRVNEADSFNVKTYLDPFIFLSENDVISAIQMLVTSGCMSRKTATELAYNIGYSSPDEVNRILQEAQDELVAEATVQQAQQRQNPVAESRANAQ